MLKVEIYFSLNGAGWETVFRWSMKLLSIQEYLLESNKQNNNVIDIGCREDLLYQPSDSSTNLRLQNELDMLCGGWRRLIRIGISFN